MSYPHTSLDPQIVERLAARYPGVRIVEAFLAEGYNGALQQNVRFQAPLEVLKAHGLLTDDMVRNTTPIGDGFSLTQGLDKRSTHGHSDLFLFTGAVPRERDRFSTREAQRVLKQFARASHKRREVRHG